MNRKKSSTNTPANKRTDKPRAKKFGDAGFQWSFDNRGANERALEKALEEILQMLDQTDDGLRLFMLLVYLMRDTEDHAQRGDIVHVIEDVVMTYGFFRNHVEEFTYGKQEQEQ